MYQNPDADEKDIEYEDYSVEDYFYNKSTGEKFSYGNPKDEESDEGKDIPQLSYVYMAIPVEQDLRIESFARDFNATQTCSMEVFFYVVDELPNGGNFKNIWLLGEPEYQQKPDHSPLDQAMPQFPNPASPDHPDSHRNRNLRTNCSLL